MKIIIIIIIIIKEKKNERIKMCLSIPGKIVEIKKNIATIDYNGTTRNASTTLMPEVKIGDYVIVSAKMIIQIIPKEEARKTLNLWDETDKQ